MGKRCENNIDREKFEKAMQFCALHSSCPSYCPIFDECNGSYDMLYKTFDYVKELKEENERLRSEKEQCQ